MNRIAPEQVVEAFRRHPEVRPASGFFVDLDYAGVRAAGCCGSAILALDRLDPEGLTILNSALADEGSKILAPLLGVDRAYVVGFAAGWDGERYAGATLAGPDEEALARGEADGRAAYRAVMDDILPGSEA